MEKLEQKAETFYNRLNKEEPVMIQGIVEHIKACMKYEMRDNKLLIAGVGGILRYSDPKLAQDIDLAVVGLKYTDVPNDHKSHSFNDVVKFTQTVNEYFRKLYSSLISDMKLKVDEKIEVKYGSGPFKGLDDREYNFSDAKGNISNLRSELESFNIWGSKGLQMCFPDIRPIDIQFVFNQTPDEWKSNQLELPEQPGGELYSEKGKCKKFPYAVLSI